MPTTVILEGVVRDDSQGTHLRGCEPYRRMMFTLTYKNTPSHNF